MSNKIYIEPLGDALNIMGKQSEILCLPVRTDCTPYTCDTLVKDCNEQWNRLYRKRCSCAKPYFLRYPQDEALTFQTQFAVTPTTSIIVTLKDCNENIIPLDASSFSFQYNENDIQNFEIDTSQITQNLIGGWYLCFEHTANDGKILDCFYTQFYQPFEVMINEDCVVMCKQGTNYVKIETCNNYDCCGTVYGELLGENIGSSINHKGVIWIDGFIKEGAGSLENTIVGAKSKKSVLQDITTVTIGKTAIPRFAHRHLMNILTGGIVKINGVKCMIPTFAPENSVQCKEHFRYSFDALKECEVKQSC